MSSNKKNWFGEHKLITGVAGAAIVIIAATSAGGSNSTNVTTTPSKASTSSSAVAAPSTTIQAKATAAHVGSTLNLRHLSVTLTKVIDPAQGADQYTTPDPGKRFVATELTITNNSSTGYSNDANSNVTLIGTDNQSYTPDYNSVSECTNFNSGVYTLASGESSTGCVVFQVPTGVNPAKVQFSSSILGNNTGEWLVP